MQYIIALLVLVLIALPACKRQDGDANNSGEQGSSSKAQQGVNDGVDAAGEGVKKGAAAAETGVNKAADGVSTGLQAGADAIDDTFGGNEGEQKK